MKKVLALLLSAILAMAFIPAAVASDTIVIGVLLSDTSNTFFVTMQEAIEATAAELGAQTIVLDGANDAAKDVTNMEDLISAGVDFVLYNPVDSNAAAAVVEAAAAVGIPVISIDRSVSGAEVVSHIASDNVYGGRIATEYAIGLIGGEGYLAEIQGQAGASAANERHQGFNEAVAANGKVEVVSSQIGDWDTTKAMEIMENILTAFPEVQAVFCANDNMAVGAVQACQQNGRADVFIVGFDCEAVALQAIAEGTLAATIKQQPALMGQMGVETAIAFLKGEPVESNIGVEVALVNTAE